MAGNEKKRQVGQEGEREGETNKQKVQSPFRFVLFVCLFFPVQTHAFFFVFFHLDCCFFSMLCMGLRRGECQVQEASV